MGFVCFPTVFPRHSLESSSKNDLPWLISMRAVKMRHSLRNWGYIDSAQCASFRRVQTIDHCFFNCKRVKAVWAYFLPLLSVIVPLCSFISFPLPARKISGFSSILSSQSPMESGFLGIRPLFVMASILLELLSRIFVRILGNVS